MLKDLYINMKLFGTSDNDYDVVALVLGPDEMGSDALGLRLRCNKTGQVRGRVVDEESIYWNMMKRFLPQGFHIIQARLSEFTEFSRDAEGSLWTNNDLLFEVIDEFGNPIANDQIFASYSQRSLPTPTRDHIIRVAGPLATDGFLFTGATWHYRLNLLAKRYRGHDVLASDKILDWGVGCGRIARHFLEGGSCNIVGADIDAFNVKWLNDSVGREVAIRIDFDPPMPFPADHFDIIYGHSVFTHLTYEAQFKWLAELRRVLKPGEFAFLTVCAEPGVLITRFSDCAGFWDKFISDGFYDRGALSIGVDEGREGYYRHVFHTQKFINENWSKYFIIRRALPCYIEHQTLLILQKPK